MAEPVERKSDPRVQVCPITGGPLDFGLIGLVQFLPFVVLVLPAGQL